MQPKKILFVYTHFSTFVEIDFELLSSKYSVTKYHFIAKKGLINTGLAFIEQFFYLLFNIWKYDAVFVWFADYHSFLPVLFAKLTGKKSFVVVGGYDVANIPELNYGVFNKPIRSFMAKNTFRYATCCFPVAEELCRKLKIISPKAKAETLATSFDEKKFNFATLDREKTVVTISTTTSYQRFMIKGLDRFRELSLAMPEYNFILLGISPEFQFFFEPTPKNLQLLPSQPHDQVPMLLEKCSFYAQFSRTEGLPNALCEAMLCGCIPIATAAGDNKIAIGNAGLCIDDWNVELASEFIYNNHKNSSLRTLSRNQIIGKYDNKTRKKILQSII